MNRLYPFIIKIKSIKKIEIKLKRMKLCASKREIVVDVVITQQEEALQTRTQRATTCDHAHTSKKAAPVCCILRATTNAGDAGPGLQWDRCWTQAPPISRAPQIAPQSICSFSTNRHRSCSKTVLDAIHTTFPILNVLLRSVTRQCVQCLKNIIYFPKN